MDFVADESVAGPILARLRADGHVVESVRESSPGILDPAVLQRATSNGQLLLTEDKDFGELVYRDHATHLGVVLVRLDGLSRRAKCDIVSAAFRDHGPEFAGSFTVISARGVRIRKPTPPDPQP